MKYAVQKRPLSILEVLIAFFLVVVCLLPLVYPHTYIYKLQYEFVEAIQCDRLAGIAFADILERLHKQEIEWKDITGKAELQIPDALFVQENMPLTGKYSFALVKKKEDKDAEYVVSLYAVKISFANKYHKEKTYQYSYQTVIIYDPNHTGGPHKKKEGAAPAKENAAPAKENAAPEAKEKGP